MAGQSQSCRLYDKPLTMSPDAQHVDRNDPFVIHPPERNRSDVWFVATVDDNLQILPDRKNRGGQSVRTCAGLKNDLIMP